MKIKKLTLILSLFALTACGNPISSSSFNSSSSNESTIPMVPTVVSESSSNNPTSSESSISSSSSEVSSSEQSSSSFESSNESSSEVSSSTEESLSSESSSTSTYTEPVPVTAYNNYYVNLLSWENGEDLKNQLHTIIRTGYHALSYDTPNWETNVYADHTKYDFEMLDIVYTATDISKNESGKGWQREHAFCASLMTGSSTGNAVKQKGRATDFHNLFASEASANGSRGNKNYGTADKSATNYTNRTVNNGQDGYSFAANFEPGNYDKGRLSRAIFYMATMYKDDEYDSANGVTMKGLQVVEDPVAYVSGNNCAFAHGNLSTLLNWNNTYGVDYLEMQHNISVYKDVYAGDGVAQGNRNPYVDFPELVDYVYGSKKNQPGKLCDLTPTESVLHTNDHVVDHYALKEAKREYEYGAQLSSNDYKIVKVYKDYSYALVNSGYTHSLSSHTFSESDGEYIDATITTETNNITYRIMLDPTGSCSIGPLALTASGLDKHSSNVNQNVTYNSVQFVVNYVTSADVSSKSMTITNISSGGVTIGSGTYPLTSLTITTKNSYTVDAAYIKACIGNVSSSYQLTIKVGETVLLNNVTVNNKDVFKVYGASVSSPLTGKISYIFTGSTSLKINSIAFNDINA